MPRRGAAPPSAIPPSGMPPSGLDERSRSFSVTPVTAGVPRICASVTLFTGVEPKAGSRGRSGFPAVEAKLHPQNGIVESGTPPSPLFERQVRGREADAAERDPAQRDASERDASERDASERDASERRGSVRLGRAADRVGRDAADRDRDCAPGLARHVAGDGDLNRHGGGRAPSPVRERVPRGRGRVWVSCSCALPKEAPPLNSWSGRAVQTLNAWPPLSRTKAMCFPSSGQV